MNMNGCLGTRESVNPGRDSNRGVPRGRQCPGKAKTTVMLIMCVLYGVITGGCSLITIESPAEPLPERDLNARMLTREYAFIFTNSIAEEANRIFGESEDIDVQIAVLRWKINASAVGLVSATQISPMLSLLDTWAFTVQMQEFLSAEAQIGLFGDDQASAVRVSEDLTARIRDIARSTTTRDEFVYFNDLVSTYTAEYPLTDLGFERVPIMASHMLQGDDDLFQITTVGTAAEAMSDIADRMRLYGDLVPQASRWQLDLLMLESGVTSEDISAAVRRMDSHMSRLADFTDASPAMLDKASRDLAIIARRTSVDMQNSAIAIVQAITREREAIIRELDGQSETLYDTVDRQRAALTDDMERISADMTNLVFERTDRLVSTAGIYIIFLYIVFFTMPFVAGFFVGKARGRSAT